MAHTKKETSDQIDAATTKQTAATAYAAAVNAYYLALGTYHGNCFSRRNAVANSISAADLAFVDSCDTALHDCRPPMFSKYGDQLTAKANGNTALAAAGQAFTAGNYDMAYGKASDAITAYTQANTLGTAAVGIGDGGKENGIQGNARINGYGLANPPDPGDPVAPTSPTAP